ncbi:MAG TPA: cupin domain-containing protein [Gaiellaceae bacterium]|nr:cupin domain-containing protein [Gaiellaceae bacterium]
MQHLAHWDDVEGVRREAGHLAGTWRDLGRAAGTLGAGVKLIDVDPGKWSTPAHSEGAEEEIFFVLRGFGLSWQDGAAYEVRAGDCLFHRPHGKAHTLRAGPDGLGVLAFGQRVAHGNTVLPRAGVAWMEPGYVDVTVIDGDHHPYRREAAAGEPEVGERSPRPASIAAVDDVEPTVLDRGGTLLRDRSLGDAVGSVRTGMSHVTIPPGKLGYPPHCHSAEEEIFVVLSGEGTLLLGDEEQPVRAGHVVARPPGTRVAHAFRGGGDEGIEYLAYGTREPNDIAYFPRSGKIFIRGVGAIGRLERLGYWDGEE